MSKSSNEMGADIPILVVDDEPQIIEAFRSVLGSETSSEGSELSDLRARLFPDTEGTAEDTAPTTASSPSRFLLEAAYGAEEAVEKVRLAVANGLPYTVIFLDMRMRPGPDGVWAAERIRAIDPLVEIVICTAYSDVSPEDIAHRVQPPEKLFYIQKPFHLHEVRQIAHALGHKRVAEDEVVRLAYFDTLTGLPNREQILRATQSAIDTAKDQNTRFALLYFDLDRFKRINDALGHSVGDELLKQIGDRLLHIVKDDPLIQTMMESSPIPCDVARLGGDEFLVLLPGIASGKDAERVAIRIQEQLDSPITLDICELIVTHTVGVSLYPDHGEDAGRLFDRADLAMYYAKRTGKGVAKLFDESMNEEFLRHLTLENLLRTALENEELFLRYQPQLDLQTGECRGLEALLRWQCPEVGVVSPAEFIPLAEESGLIISIGEWVLREACRQAAIWCGEGSTVMRVGVNISAMQLSQDDFPEMVERILRESQLPPQYLELEVTESMLIREQDPVREKLHRLKNIGVTFAIDDFGTGYSSLNRLQEFSVDRLKIDRSFVTNIASQDSDAGIASAIINMGRTLGLEVIAEGVEYAAQLDILQVQNCEQVQGYLISKPIDADEVKPFLDKLKKVNILDSLRQPVA